jgi:hypothetical protein
MAESVSVTNWPDSGSNERVAYDLCVWLIPSATQGQSFDDRKKQVLDLYVDCLNATRGHRPK